LNLNHFPNTARHFDFGDRVPMAQPAIRKQYESYPYPARNPTDETKRLITGSPSNLAELNHYIFSGARDFSQPFRALVAGGGTGDGAIMLAQQLADAGSSGAVVYLDLSEASRRIAERRAEVRNLSNITFHSGSLFDAATLGPFDYIDCCGVLHHLEAPEEGLSALAGALSPHGGMGLMVYGKYGRNGVYPLQKMLRALGSGLSLHEQVEIAKKLVESLPASNWFKHNPMLVDHRNSDAGLVDLLLHSQDRAYLVEEVGALVNSAGLSIVSFVPPVQYEPSHLLQDPELLERLNRLNPMARAAFAEQLSGNLKQHAFYVVPDARAGCTTAVPGPRMVPTLSTVNASRLAMAIRQEGCLAVKNGPVTLRSPVPKDAAVIAEQIDNRRTLSEIHNLVGTTLENVDFDTAWGALYKAANSLNLMYLQADKS
jgi:SAM-dependent methyltransferase